ncbi:MAG: ABC transporter ATP-binding protein [Sulfolobaceae archaeon]
MEVMVRDLRKKFGQKEVIRGMSFDVNEGIVFGIIGPNGAGKTTILRILAGIITRYEGLVKIHDLPPVKARIKGLISYMPEDAFPYEKLTGLENLKFFASLYARGDKKLEEEYLENGIKIADLGDKLYEKTSTYSRGMKRRLMIARTLMVMPKIAILDEPTSALDVEASVKVREIISRIPKTLGSTVIISSHNMLEVEYICDEIILINNGKIVANGRPKDIIRNFNANNLEEVFIRVLSRDKVA